MSQFGTHRLLMNQLLFGVIVDGGRKIHVWQCARAEVI